MYTTVLVVSWAKKYVKAYCCALNYNSRQLYMAGQYFFSCPNGGARRELCSGGQGVPPLLGPDGEVLDRRWLPRGRETEPQERKKFSGGLSGRSGKLEELDLLGHSAVEEWPCHEVRVLIRFLVGHKIIFMWNKAILDSVTPKVYYSVPYLDIQYFEKLGLVRARLQKLELGLDSNFLARSISNPDSVSNLVPEALDLVPGLSSQ